MPKMVWLLVIGMLVNTTGNSFLWPLNTIYLNEHLGQSLSVAGLVLMANAAAGVVGNLLGGYLFDKIGGYKTIMVGIVITIIGLALLTIWHGWPHYVYFLTLIGFSGGIVFPSMYAMVGIVWPEGGRRGFNAIYLAQNVGVAFGPVLAGLVATLSFDYIFSANLIMYIVFFFIAFSYASIKVEESYAATTMLSEGGKLKDRTNLYALCILGIGFMIAWLVYSQWTTTISSYTQTLDIPLTQYSLLWTVNGLIIVLGQPLIKPIVKRLEDNFKAQLLIGLAFFVASFLVVSYAGTFKMFLMAMIIISFGEMFIFPVVPTIASMLAPKGKDGFFQGIVNSFSTLGKMLGPFIGGVLADSYGMHITFIILTIVMVAAIVPFVLYDLPLRRKKARELAVEKSSDN
ncbi:putative MFS-type transporter YttB [Kurthia zopfii]|uniref:MFS family arabinose efflux permease n=1 Tax=Kurthia zopfii TaxID=1650 RepID=A0A8B4QCE5_9BACL|nr:MFS transporter [Kurthia zopfii]PWI21483.1 MFS transporter [Kurthia zopfii]TDR34743.1 putative MFS family arabinose efflux permease [Kurthia zopfii]GEK31855.1 putative MFS-type transporter YttB [Kurthia zopfii]STX10369.1 putative arabinose transporter [Kurthia zopfii]